MQFNSYSYLLALLIAVPVFWALPIRARPNYVLTVSFAYYATWNINFLVLPIAISAIALWSASSIRKGGEIGRRALWIGIVTVLLILGFFKYGSFSLQNAAVIGAWFGEGTVSLTWNIALPLGISFYSFEAISYLLDTKQGRVKSTNYRDLLLFIMFWPHLMAGPIVRTRELFPQLKFDRPFESTFFYKGMDRLLFGLVQKNLIANTIGSWVDEGFLPKTAVLNTSFDNWTLAIAFGIQIYFDFAAYSNMAIGASQLIGITLPENFRFPYHAGNPVDFWSRWHMTLSRWIRDYIFFPINAGFQNDKVRLYISLVGVMGLVGLWHGAGWGFIVWGVMHGAYLAAFRAFENWKGDFAAQSFAMKAVWRCLTLAAIVAAWVPFRAPSIQQSATMLKSMFEPQTFAYSYSVNFYLVTVLCCIWIAIEPTVAFAVSRISEFEILKSWNCWAARPAGYAIMLYFFVIFDDRDSQFIYFQF